MSIPLDSWEETGKDVSPLLPPPPSRTAADNRAFIRPKLFLPVSEAGWLTNRTTKQPYFLPFCCPFICTQDNAVILPHLRLMLDTCPRIHVNCCVSFHNQRNVLPRLMRKHREMNLYPLRFAIHFSSLFWKWNSLGWSFMQQFHLLPSSTPPTPPTPIHRLFGSKSEQLSSGQDQVPKLLRFLEIFLLSQIFLSPSLCRRAWIQVGFWLSVLCLGLHPDCTSLFEVCYSLPAS